MTDLLPVASMMDLCDYTDNKFDRKMHNSDYLVSSVGARTCLPTQWSKVLNGVCFGCLTGHVMIFHERQC